MTGVPFTVALERTEPVVLMSAAGEVDAASVAELDAAFEQAISEHQAHVVFDACDITFIDSTGISALVGGLRRLNRSRRRLAIACGPEGAVGRALQVTGLDHTFECHPDRETALEALSGAPLIGR
jgi:anti-sigma B factor antagonist